MKFNRCMDNMDGYKQMAMPEGMMEGYPAAMPEMGMPQGCCPTNQVMMCPPVMECPQERCCHRVINYEAPHIIPCHTRMVNHHIYKHTYQPCYSYSEEDEYSQIYDQPCCK